ncbi:MAG: N-acetylmuramoyl-L-alanine amidase [Bacteroidota bacterium]
MSSRYLLIFLVWIMLGIVGGKSQGFQDEVLYDLTKNPPAELVSNIISSAKGIQQIKVDQVGLFFSRSIPIQLPSTTPFIAVSLTGRFSELDTTKYNVYLSSADTEQNLGNFRQINVFHHLEDEDSLFQSELMFFEENSRFFQFLVLFKDLEPGQSPVSLSEFEFQLFAPGHSNVDPANPGSTTLNGANPNCNCGIPAYANRTSWGSPTGQDYSNGSPSYATVSHMIIHHSAGPNTSADWGATVLSIWNFHVNTRGWNDIGYNWLIDPNGVIYEGRGGGNNVIGAHFCGKNTGTMGVCLLGTYEQEEPSAKAIASLEKLLAWKMCDANLAPLDTTIHLTSGDLLPVISGHKDGCSTSCPGSELHDELPSVRQGAIVQFDSCTSVQTSIEPLDMALDLNVYPNPTTGSVTLEWNQATPAMVSWDIYDTGGRTLWHESGFWSAGSAQKRIDLAHLPAGIYLVRIDNGREFTHKKLVLRK